MTIKDVARRSGVAIATVSRVINDNYPVSETVRASVWAAIHELGYRPNLNARSLKTRTTRTVGVIVADFSNPFFMLLVKGLESRLSENGYSIMIAAHDERPEKERQIVEMLLENNVAAIITTTCQMDGAYFRALCDAGVPLVLTDRALPGFEADCVSEDNLDASRRVTQYLIERGHRRIAIVNGTMTVSTSTLRHEGYLSALRAAGIAPDERLIVDGGSGTAYPATVRLLSALPRAEWPTALFATNNLRCEGALQALIHLGVRVPEDISIASYGDIALPWLSGIRLTHVRQDLMALGARTADLTVARIKGEDDPSPRILQSELAIGNSVKSLLRQ